MYRPSYKRTHLVVGEICELLYRSYPAYKVGKEIIAKSLLRHNVSACTPGALTPMTMTGMTRRLGGKAGAGGAAGEFGRCTPLNLPLLVVVVVVVGYEMSERGSTVIQTVAVGVLF